MPKYSYKCTHCDGVFFFFHSMSEVKEDCQQCDKEKTLEKQPSLFSTRQEEIEKQVGDTVRKSIKDFKADLEAQKDRLSNEHYNSNK